VSSAVKTHAPVAGSHVSVVHAIESSHGVGGLPGWHPDSASHFSMPSHAFWLLHSASTGVCTHPSVGSHVSFVHAIASAQFKGVPATHPVVAFALPFVGSHFSVPLHTVESLHTLS
jgi:hypothetical protein